MPRRVEEPDYQVDIQARISLSARHVEHILRCYVSHGFGGARPREFPEAKNFMGIHIGFNVDADGNLGSVIATYELAPVRSIEPVHDLSHAPGDGA